MRGPLCYFIFKKWCLKRSYFAHQIFILVFTFICYAAFHMSRKPISIVKSVLHKKCPQNVMHNNDEWCNWKPFDGPDWSQKLGSLEYAYLLSYAVFMFVSGHLAERINLRLYLAIGMISSGILTSVFGMAYFLSIHNFLFFFFVQIITGITQATGWPAVVTLIGNWFAKGRRGLIMGIWNSHTSFGNVVGSVIAGLFVSSAWGYSFVIPGIIMSVLGVIVLLLMIPYPEDVGLSSPDDQRQIIVELKEDKFKNLISSGSKPLLPYHDRQTDKAITVCEALKLPNVVAYSTALFFAKLVAYTFLYWLPNYLNAVGKGLSPKTAGDLSTLFDLGGIIGGIMAGYISDIWMTSSSDLSTSNGRSGTCAIMLTLAAPSLFFYQSIAASQSTFSFFMLFVCGILVNGPYALITTAVSADIGSQNEKHNSRALATVTAIIDGTGSLGAAFGPFLTGLIVPTGWLNVFVMLIIADFLALLAVIYIILQNKQSDCYCTKNVMHSQSRCDNRFKALFVIFCVMILLATIYFFSLL